MAGRTPPARRPWPAWAGPVLALSLLAAISGCSCESRAGGQGVTPLSKDVFLFMRAEAGASEKHLYAYDLKTRQARLVFDFSPGNVLPDFQMSRDRRWVVVTAVGFGLDASDQRPAVQIMHLWKISVDGRQSVRLTRPIYPADDTCPEYVNSYGPHEQTCLREHTDPVFSPDGRSIYFSLFQGQDIVGTLACNNNADCPGMSTCYNRLRCSGIRLRGGSRLARISSRGGVHEDLPLNSGCLFESNPTFSHGGDRMLFTLSQCAGRRVRPGIHLLEAPIEQTVSRPVVRDEGLNGAMAWKPDDSGFLYQAGRCIKEYSFAYRSTATRFRAGHGELFGFAPNADHSLIVVAIKPKLKKTAGLYLLHADSGKLERLTSGYNDTWPCWYP
jgi:hypothetical protein